MESANIRPRHMVFVRHGESEGDVRRSMGQPIPKNKHPQHELQTKLGHEQSRTAGQWILQHVLKSYDLEKFDTYLSSPLIRARQSAESMDLSDEWQSDPRLSERDRGAVQGLTKDQHLQQYPDSFRQMQEHPMQWTPPEGESMLHVSGRLAGLLGELEQKYDSVVLMTHRDILWVTHGVLDGLQTSQLEQVDTDKISNGHIFHYTNISPDGKIKDEKLVWKRSINPVGYVKPQKVSAEWVDLSQAQSRLLV